MTRKHHALVSPAGNAVGVLSNDRAFVTLVSDADGSRLKVSTEQFIRTNSDFSVIDVDDENDAIRQLDERIIQSRCLDMTLFMFDPEIEVELREELADELNPMLQEKANRDYVLDIMLASPLPRTADADGAIVASDRAIDVHSLILEVVERQAQVEILHETWAATSREQLARQTGPKLFHGALIRCGVFRQVALCATDKESLTDLQGNVAYNHDLNAQFNITPRIISQWFDRIKASWPTGPICRVEKPAFAGSTYQPSGPRYVTAHRVVKHQTDRDAYEAALTEIDTISDLFAEENDSKARSFLAQLLQTHLTHADGETFAVKTLCNIASKVGGRGRLDISAECVEKALTYTHGVDCRAYSQLGTLLRDSRRFDEAIVIYDRAEQLANGNNEDLRAIRSAKIHILTMQYEYLKAIEEYKELMKLDDQYDGFVSIGDLYRKLGQFKDAAEHYRLALKEASYCHRAVAGQAEIWKQKGKPHRAIEGYNKLFERFGSLKSDDKTSYIVYKTAYAHLLRIVGQDEKAKDVLQKLYLIAPSHPSVNFQLLALYQSQNDLPGVELHKHRMALKSSAIARSREEILESILNNMTGTSHPIGVSQWKPPLGLVPPEMKATVQCVSALSSLVLFKPEDAIQALESVSAVDRSIEDLSMILKFHASAQHDVSHAKSYMNQRLGVLAKRGSKMFRQTINAILHGDFKSAIEYESSLLLRLAS